MEYSQRLGNITDEQFQKALDRFELGQLIKAESIPFGNFGQNVFLTTTIGEYVFRGKPHYAWQFKSEQFMADLLHKKTKTPVPYPYLVDEQTDIFGWGYVIMHRLNGKQLKDKSVKDQLTIEDKKDIARAFGENLAEMQTLTWDFSGQYDLQTGSIKAFDKPFDQWIIDRIKELANLCSTYGDKTPKTDIEWIDKIIEDGVEAMRVVFTPTFVMHDYQESNMVVDKIDGKWKVTGVFDLMENYFGDGESDLPRMFIAYAEEDMHLAYIFLNSYLSKHKVRPGFEKRFPIYVLIDRLIVWEWAQRTGKCWWNSKFTFRDWCGEFSQLDEKLLVIK